MSSLPAGSSMTAALNAAQFGGVAPLSSSAGIGAGSMNAAIAGAGGVPVGGIAAPSVTSGTAGLDSATAAEGFDYDQLSQNLQQVGNQDKQKEEEDRKKAEEELRKAMQASQQGTSTLSQGGVLGGKSYGDIMGLYRR